MKKIISLIPRSDLDDLRCPDGEIESMGVIPGGGEPSLPSDLPAAPSGRFTAVPASLPPYSSSATSLPRLNVSVDVGAADMQAALAWLAGTDNSCPDKVKERVLDAVKGAVAVFVRAVADAGLHFSPVWVTACWQLVDGRLWRHGDIRLVRLATSQVELRITDTSASEGILYIGVTLSRQPFTVTFDGMELAPGSPWRDVIEKAVVAEGPEVADVDLTYLSNPVWLEGSARGFLLGHRDVSGAVAPEGLFSEIPDDASALAGGEGEASDAFVTLHTRPIKLGDPFALKYLERIEAEWPDGSVWPVTVYGALRLGKWYCLGAARRGRAHLRGSAFRYFRLVTMGSLSALPLIKMQFSEENRVR